MLKEIVSDQAVVAVLTLQIVCMLASGSFVWDCNVRMRACDTKDLYVMVLGPWDDSVLHLSFWTSFCSRDGAIDERLQQDTVYVILTNCFG